MRKVMMAFGAMAWFVVVFLVAFWMTFPSQALGDRMRVEVFKGSGGDYHLELANVRPWWTGIAADNVVVYQVSPPRGREPATRTPAFAFESARVRAGLFSLLREAPRIQGEVQIGRSDVGFDVTLAMNKRGTQLTPRDIHLSAPGYPVQDLAGLAGLSLEATGVLDLAVDLKADEGMRDAVGEVVISGQDVVITRLDEDLTGGLDLGMEVPIDELDLRIDVENGTATIRTGVLKSALMDAEFGGDIALRDDLMRSTLNVTIKLELGDELAMFRGFLKRAEQEDGSFKYRCTATLAHPSCREDTGDSRSAGSSRTTTDRRRAARDAEGDASPGMTDAEREKRRTEALERLRAAAGDRSTGNTGSTGSTGASGDVQTTAPPPGPELEELGYVEDEDPDDEEPSHEGEELPPDEGGFDDPR